MGQNVQPVTSKWTKNSVWLIDESQAQIYTKEDWHIHFSFPLASQEQQGEIP